MEEAYTATEDPAFLLELNNAVRKLVSKMDPTLIRDILRSYFATVQRSVSNAAPKCIMLFLVNGVKNRLHATLFEGVMRAQVAELLDEPGEVRDRRLGLHSRLTRLSAAIAELEQTGRAQPNVAVTWR
ncbi:Dynamin GTPase effector domain-containing protein [Pavlovales sp. CCMP2436]|nr:Dynamin GTPase effector domain-containing protein [Pavlovales sp. CCMP2436]